MSHNHNMQRVNEGGDWNWKTLWSEWTFLLFLECTSQCFTVLESSDHGKSEKISKKIQNLRPSDERKLPSFQKLEMSSLGPLCIMHSTFFPSFQSHASVKKISHSLLKKKVSIMTTLENLSICQRAQFKKTRLKNSR